MSGKVRATLPVARSTRMRPEDVLRSLSQAPASLALIDRAGLVAWTNATGYGLDLEAVLGRPADSWAIPEDAPVWWDAFFRARDCHEVVRYTVRLRVPDTPHIVRITGRTMPIHDPDGRVSYVLVISQDATHVPGDQCHGCVHHAPAGPTPTGPTPGRWLSPLGERIVAALGNRVGCWTTADALATILGEAISGDLRPVLRDLAERGILDSAPGRGYRLASGAVVGR